jgi:hypothetical protein
VVRSERVCTKKEERWLKVSRSEKGMRNGRRVEEWRGEEWSGVERRGVKWSGEERSEVES